MEPESAKDGSTVQRVNFEGDLSPCDKSTGHQVSFSADVVESFNGVHRTSLDYDPMGTVNVLICTSNLGNTEPSALSVSSVIPKNGLIANACCVEESAGAANPGLVGRKTNGEFGNQSFEIMAVGMQESTVFAEELSKIGKVQSGKNILEFFTCEDKQSSQTVDIEEVEKDTMHRSWVMQNHCPPYETVLHYRRGGMRLVILVRKDVLHEVTDIDCRAENTGIGNFLPNKGGIVATLTIRKTRLAFVTGHLEAHEGADHFANRCDDITNILDGAKVGPSPRWYDASMTNHHCFVFGDLNYRIALPGDVTHEEHVQKVLSMIDKQDWGALNDADELSKALREGDCLAGFQTLPCHFSPTFKLQKEEGYAYIKKRTPSYTDRILWKSLVGLESHLQPLDYHPCPNFSSSDHKPVRGVFSIKTNARATLAKGNQGKPHISSRRERIHAARKSINFPSINQSMFHVRNTKKSLHIFVSDMKCIDLNSRSIGNGQCYIMCDTHPKELIKGRKVSTSTSCCRKLCDWKSRHWDGCPCTKELGCCKDPKWNEEEVHLKLIGDVGKASLSGSMLYINVIGYELDRRDAELLGTVRLNLQNLCYPPEEQFPSYDSRRSIESADSSVDGMLDTVVLEEPIMKNGRVYGTLHCSILVWFMTENERPSRLTRRKSRKISWHKR